MIADLTTHTTGINWDAVGAIAGPVIALGGWVFRVLARKLDQVGDHLERQDHSKRELGLRIGRIEEKLDMKPMILNGDS